MQEFSAYFSWFITWCALGAGGYWLYRWFWKEVER